MAHSIDRIRSFAGIARECRSVHPALGVPLEALHVGGRTRSIIRFAAGSSVLVGLGLLILWALTGFADLGVRGHGLVALMLGIVFTTGLGSTLMALIFYSDRSGERDGIEQPGQMNV